MTMGRAALLLLVAAALEAGRADAQAIELHAEAFPAGAPVPGYAGVRIRASRRGGDLDTVPVRLQSARAETQFEVAIPAERSVDFVLAVYRDTSSPIDVSVGTAGAVVDPGPASRTVLVVGSLEDAERASDRLGVSLREILRIDHAPALDDPAALDGFAAVWDAGLPERARARYAARGGCLVATAPASAGPPLTLREPSLAATLASRLGPRGLTPRDVVGVSSAPLRLALAYALVLAVAAKVLGRGRTRRLVGTWIVVASGGIAIGLSLRMGSTPRIELFPGGGTILVLESGAPVGHVTQDEALPVPCGAAGRFLRKLGARTIWESDGAVLLVAPLPPEPLFEGSRLPNDPTSTRGSKALRTVLAGLPALLGGPAVVSIDRARGILRAGLQTSR